MAAEAAIARTAEDDRMNNQFFSLASFSTGLSRKWYDSVVNYHGIYNRLKKDGGLSELQSDPKLRMRVFVREFPCVKDPQQITRGMKKMAKSLARYQEFIYFDVKYESQQVSASKNAEVTVKVVKAQEEKVIEFAESTAERSASNAVLLRLRNTRDAINFLNDTSVDDINNIALDILHDTKSMIKTFEAPPLRSIAFLAPTQTGKSTTMNLFLALGERPNYFYDDSVLDFEGQHFLDGLNNVEDIPCFTLGGDRPMPHGLCVLIRPNTKADKYVTKGERDREEISQKALKDYAFTDKSKAEIRKFQPFMLPMGKPGGSDPVTNVNITVRYGDKYHVVAQYLSELEITGKVDDLRKFEEDDSNIEGEEKASGITDVDKETGAMRRLLEKVSSSPKTATFPEGKNIVFTNDAKQVLGKSFCVTSVGKNPTDDRIFIRRALHGIIYHGLLADWPADLSMPDDDEADASTFALKDVIVYVPCRLLENNVEWIDAPGSNDLDPVRYLQLKKTLESCGSLVLMTKMNLQGEAAAAEFVQDVVIPRLVGDSENNLTGLRVCRFSEQSDNMSVESFEEGFAKEKKTGHGKDSFIKAFMKSADKSLGGKASEQVMAELRKNVEASFLHPYPLLYTSLIKNSRRRILDADRLREVMENTQGRGLLHFLADASSGNFRKTIEMFCNNFEGKITKLIGLQAGTRFSDISKVIDQKKDLFSKASCDEYFKKSLKIPHAQTSLDSIEETNYAKTLIADYASGLDKICGDMSMLFERGFGTRTSVFMNSFEERAISSAKKNVGATTRYFDSDLVRGKLNVNELVDFEWTRQLVAHDLAQTKIVEYVKTKFPNEDDQNKLGVSEAQGALQTILKREMSPGLETDGKTKIRRRLIFEVVDVLKKHFYDTFKFSIPPGKGKDFRKKVMEEYEKKHAEFKIGLELKFRTFVREYVERVATQNLAVNILNHRGQWLLERFYLMYCSPRAGSTYKWNGYQTKLVNILKVAKLALANLQVNIQPNSDVFESTLMTTSILNSTAAMGKFPDVDKSLSKDPIVVDLTGSRLFIRELDIKVREHMGGSRIDKAIAISMGINRDRNSEAAKMFSTIRDQWPAILESAYKPQFAVTLPNENAPYSTFLNFRDDFVDSEFKTIGAFLKLVVPKSNDDDDYQNKIKLIFSTSKYHVPLLIGACETFNCAFNVTIDDAKCEKTIRVSCIRPRATKIPVFCLKWSKAQGWEGVVPLKTLAAQALPSTSSSEVPPSKKPKLG